MPTVKSTRVDLQADRTIESGNTIIVNGIIIANEHTSPVTVDFQTNSAAVRFSVVCPAQDSRFIDWAFLADSGLVIDGLASNGDKVFVSIFHTSGGA